MRLFVRKHAHVLAFAALNLWAAFIWSQSLKNGTASSAVSDGVVSELSWLFAFTPALSAHAQTFLVRKFAHFSEYFILGALAGILKSLPKDKDNMLCKVSKFLCYAYVLLVPIIDELIQTYVPGRDGNPFDVCLDIFGACCALGLQKLIFCLRKSRMR